MRLWEKVQEMLRRGDRELSRLTPLLGVSCTSQLRSAMLETPKSLQFRAEEVATLEKRQRKFENPGFIGIERKFLGALGRGAARSDFILITTASLGYFSLDDNPCPTSWTGNARADNAIRHTKIIKCF
jgi:hypothetical protein